MKLFVYLITLTLSRKRSLLIRKWNGSSRRLMRLHSTDCLRISRVLSSDEFEGRAPGSKR